MLPGHDYFWFLEFGTGPFHEPDGSYDEVIGGKLTPPREVKEHQAAGQAYEIEAVDAPLLVYMTKDGLRRRRDATVHPGIKPIGFVRSALFDAELYLERDIIRLKAQIKRGRRLPRRKQLVDLVNRILQTVVGTLRQTTPTDSDIDPFHSDHRPHHPTLAESWGYTEAK